jgi:hypothetical protein
MQARQSSAQMQRWQIKRSGVMFDLLTRNIYMESCSYGGTSSENILRCVEVERIFLRQECWEAREGQASHGREGATKQNRRYSLVGKISNVTKYFNTFVWVKVYLYVNIFCTWSWQGDLARTVLYIHATESTIELIGFSFRVLCLYVKSFPVNAKSCTYIKVLADWRRPTIDLYKKYIYLLRTVAFYRFSPPCSSSPRVWFIFAVLRWKAAVSPLRNRGSFVALPEKQSFVVTKVRRLSWCCAAVLRANTNHID